MDPEPYSLIFLVNSLDTSLVLGIILFLALLLCSALISGSEVALFSLSQTEINIELDEKSNSKEIVSNLLQNTQKLLATILVANNFINIGIVILFAYLGDTIFGAIHPTWLKFVLEVGVVTFLILLFGEILPKVYASRNNVKFSKFMAIPLNVLDKLITPVSMPMQCMTKAINNKLRGQKTNISVDQLSQALELTSVEDTTKEEHKILQGIVSF